MIIKKLYPSINSTRTPKFLWPITHCITSHLQGFITYVYKVGHPLRAGTICGVKELPQNSNVYSSKGSWFW